MRYTDDIDMQRGGARRRILAAALLILVLGLWACGDASKADGGAPAPRTEMARDAVEAVDHTLGALLESEALERARSQAIADQLRGEPPDGLLHRNALEHLYEGRAPVWLQTDAPDLRLNAQGRQLWSALRDGVEAHGLWPDDLNTDQVRQILSDSAATAPASPLRDLTLRPSERERLIARLVEIEERWSAADAERIVLRVLLDSEESPVARMRDAFEARLSQLDKRAHRAAAAELYLSDALLTYVRRMRWDNPAWHADRVWHTTLRRGIRGPLKPGRTVDDPKDKGSAARRVGDAVSTARAAAFSVDHIRDILAEPAQIDDALQEIVPPYEQYRRLTRAFRRYRPVVEHGGWPKLPAHAAGLEAGNFAPVVGELKERLRIEGYYREPEADDPTQEHFYDQALVDAVTAYQSTHQLYEVGSVTEPTLRSLNIPAETRWHQIRVTLQRWRASRIGPDTHYVHVNIPDYHAEVWRDGERQLRFKVVVGSSERKVEKETGRVRFPHETPRFSDRLEYMVMNPYWNVPHSIWQNEIKKEKKDNPDLYEEEGYEVVEDDNGYRFLRQKPGPKNALGQVKFLFPNHYSVYMHDTPAKGLFQRPTRAASHGCIRVSEPMKLANYLLDLDGRWERGERRDRQFKRWLNGETETWVQLQQTVPVHIEYYVVRVDEQGRAHFLADPYDLDEPMVAAVQHHIERYPGGYDLPGVQPGEMMRLALSGDLKERETPASAW